VSEVVIEKGITPRPPGWFFIYSLTRLHQVRRPSSDGLCPMLQANFPYLFKIFLFKIFGAPATYPRRVGKGWRPKIEGHIKSPSKIRDFREDFRGPRISDLLLIFTNRGHKVMHFDA